MTPNPEPKAANNADSLEHTIASLAAQLQHTNLINAAPTKSPNQPSLNIDPEDISKSLGQLVLTVVRLLHELLKKQALRRLESNSLTPQQADALGQTLALQAQEIEKLANHFGLSTNDLALDLGPLGKLI